MIISIDYDLFKPVQEYEDLIKEIKSLGAWAHALKSTWLVQTNLTPAQVYSQLIQHLDSDDKMLVDVLTPQRMGYLDKEVIDWLEKNQ